MKANLGFVTILVANLKRAKGFYEGILGFEPDIYYEPTKWQSYKVKSNSPLFAIMEQSDLSVGNKSLIEFYVADVEAEWKRLNKQAKVVEKLAKTPWGSYKFIIQDSDGNQIGFLQQTK